MTVIFRRNIPHSISNSSCGVLFHYVYNKSSTLLLFTAQVSILRGLSDQAVTVGSSVRFTCAASGSPTPKITWLHNSAPLSLLPHLQISGLSLHISSVTVQDQGIYQCLFDNGISSAQSAGRLSVQSGKTMLHCTL